MCTRRRRTGSRSYRRCRRSLPSPFTCRNDLEQVGAQRDPAEYPRRRFGDRPAVGAPACFDYVPGDGGLEDLRYVDYVLRLTTRLPGWRSRRKHTGLARGMPPVGPAADRMPENLFFLPRLSSGLFLRHSSSFISLWVTVFSQTRVMVKHPPVSSTGFPLGRHFGRIWPPGFECSE